MRTPGSNHKVDRRRRDPEQDVGAAFLRAGSQDSLAKFTVLRGAQRELWLTFLLKFLIYTAYSVTNKTMVLWLSKDLGFSDQAAGALVGWGWAPAMTVFTLLAGSLTDAIGLKRTFYLGVAICTVARAVMVRDHHPVARAHVRRVAARDRRSARHAGVARRDAPLLDHRATLDVVFHHLHGDERRLSRRGLYLRFRSPLPIRVSAFSGFEPTTHQQLFMVSLAIEIIIFPAIYFLRRGEDEDATGTSLGFDARRHLANGAAERDAIRSSFSSG